MADNLVGSLAVDVVPDVSNFRRDLAAKLRGITADITLRANTDALRAQIDEVTRSRPVNVNLSANTEALRAQVAEATHARPAVVNVSADTAVAEARIDETARDRTAHVNVESSGFTGAASGISGLAAALVTLGPALIPVAAGVAGLGAALVAPLAAAGGGLTIGGIIAGFAVKQTNKQIKALDTLHKKIDADKLALAAASTPSGRKSAQAQLTADTAAYQTALKALTPEQLKFKNAEGALGASFSKLVKAAGPAVFGPLITGMDLLAGILPKLQPLLTAVAGGVNILLADVSAFTRGSAFTQFIAGFGKASSNAIVTFGRIFENLTVGMFNVFRAFGPLSGRFTKGLGGLARSFADWSKKLGSNKGFQAFLNYVRDVGPKVAAALGSVAVAVVHLARGLAPIGGVALAAVKGLADEIRKIPVDVIAATATAVVAMVVAFKGVGMLAALANPVTLAVVAIGALVAGLVYAYSHFKSFRDLVDTVGQRLVVAFSTVRRVVADAFAAFGGGGRTIAALKQSLGTIGAAFKRAFAGAGVSNLAGSLQTIGVAITRNITPAARRLGALFRDVLLPAFTTVATSLITNFVPVLKTASTTFRTLILPAVIALGQYLTTKLVPVFAGVMVVVGKLVPVIAGLATILYGTVYPAVVKIVTAVAKQLKPVFDQLVTTITTMVLPAVGLLADKLVEWMPTIRKVTVVILAVVGFLLILAATILGKVLPVIIKFAGVYLVDVVHRLIDMTVAIAKVIGWLIRVGTAIGNAGAHVVTFVKTLKGRFGDAVAFVRTVPAKIAATLAGLAVRLAARARDGFLGFLNAAKTGVGGIIAFVRGLPAKVVGALAGLAAKLAGKARDGFLGFLNAERTGVTNIVGNVRGLPGRIVHALGSLSRTLFGAGKDLIQGLLDGIGAMFGKLRSGLGHVTNFIKDHKGPPSKDKVLLRPAGQQIMDGLIGGINDGEKALKSTLQGVTSRIQLPAPAMDHAALATTAHSTPTQGGHTGPMVNIENVQAHDYHDFTRQLQARARAVSGGGVTF